MVGRAITTPELGKYVIVCSLGGTSGQQFCVSLPFFFLAFFVVVVL